VAGVWITSTYVDSLIGSTQRAAVDGGSSTVFDQFELGARATVVSCLLANGYTDAPDGGSALTAGTLTTGFLQKLTAGVWCRDAYANRKGIALPQVAQDAVSILNAMMADARNGTRLAPPVPGLTRNVANGLGGSLFPATSGTSDGARPQMFSRTSLRSF
jgi:hypothetical protein